jgi:type I restriction enzyme, S subunit
MSLRGRQTTIGELLDSYGGEVKTGPFGTTLKASEYTSTGVPVISVGEIGHGEFKIHDRTPYVDEAITARLPEYVLQFDDIVFARKGSVERSALVGEQQVGWFLGSDGIRLRLTDDVSAKFVRYWISSEETKAWLIQNSTGSTMASLNQATIKRLPIILPPIEEQREIAAVLGALDDKIELNRKTAATLESMARAIYRSWFVDFDPILAKSEGRAPAHMDAETAALFPDRFDDEGLPDGWGVRPLLDVVELLSGGTPKTSVADFWNGDIPWASAKDVSQCGQAFLISTERMITSAGLAKSSTKMIPKYSTVVVARGATTGRACMFGDDMAMNQTCYALKSRNDEPFFANCMFMTEVLGITLAAHGSVFDTITTKTLQAASIITPSRELSAAFEATVLPMFERILEFTMETQTLAALRDTLLPKLMSGELRVPSARKIVEENV